MSPIQLGLASVGGNPNWGSLETRPGSGLGGVQAPGSGGVGPAGPIPTDGPSFGEALEAAIDQVDASQKQADAAVNGFAAGEIKDVHEVALALQQADLSLRLALEVRNKVVEAWQDVSRMQA